ncbi:MAG TPA: circadian clock KaiB family protein [Burkholderiaceae bacterium]
MKKGSDSETSAVHANDGEATTVFRLYIADQTVASLQAQSNLNVICLSYLQGPYDVELVDILNEPLRALSDGIIVTPTLVRVSPPPIRQIVGNLCDTEAVLQTLGLTESEKNGKG